LLFGTIVEEKLVQFQKTKKELEGDLTLVIFPFVKMLRCNPQEAGLKIGEFLVQNTDFISRYEVISGFLNLMISDEYWVEELNAIQKTQHYGYALPNSASAVMVEYSSPNTNKPLHLGHLRNNFLGYSVAEILKANGHKVIKTQVINDRGIHICKSMLAWEKFSPLNEKGERETPENTGLKGDKLVGKYYVEFDKHFNAEAKSIIEEWEAGKFDGYSLAVPEEFERLTLAKEGKDEKAIKGLDDKIKDLAKNQDGLKKGVFYQKDDGSVWIDLTADGLDEKLVLRSDGTAVYMTQDIGTAVDRFKDYPDLSSIIYTVGNEQDYHFKVLFLILEKMGFDWARNCAHLSYGMVDLPSGKMKSREGTVVDADDLMQEVVDKATEMTKERGHLEGMSENQKEELFRLIGMGGLKYYLLKVDPKKRMMFNPEESIELNGNTGPFIQYAHARIKSLLAKSGVELNSAVNSTTLLPEEKEIIKLLAAFPETVKEAGIEQSPAVLANYTYELVKTYNHFYQTIPILIEKDEVAKYLRLVISGNVAKVIQLSMRLLGINVPERM